MLSPEGQLPYEYFKTKKKKKKNLFFYMCVVLPPM